MADENPFRKKPETTDEWFEVIFDKLNAVHSEQKLTNGRVTLLEKWQADVQSKRRETSAYEAGLFDGVAQAFIQRKHWVIVTGALTGLVMVLGAVASLVQILRVVL